jgi:hypothetical protein
MRPEYRTSYWKTTLAAFGTVAVSLSLLAVPLSSLPSGFVPVVAGLLIAIALLALLVGVGGLTCLWRDARDLAGKPDLFARSANYVPRRTVLSRLGLRFLLGPALRPGDLVSVRPLAQIQASLDDRGTLEGLPFMPEMHPLTESVFRVHRRVDKINDMRNKTGLRRLRNTVTLTAVRCSGSHHGGCQAQCQLLWKDVWLRRIPEGAAQPGHGSVAARGNELSRRAATLSRPDPTPDPDPDPDRQYVCQMTRLWEASSPLSKLDIRQDLRPLLLGNLGPRGYVIGMLTRIFNWAQGLRGGTGYPCVADTPSAGLRADGLELTPNDRVFVRGMGEISTTLVKSRNRGLWFDREMVRYCGRPAVVRSRVQRIIHEATGKMVVFKTPCVVLEDAIATGEFLRFCPQHEYAFWREIWLRRNSPDTGLPAGESQEISR